MRILYVATDQMVPGTKGGSTHVTAVADGLTALGHEVHVLVSPGDGPFPGGPVRYHALAPPLGLRQLRVLRAGAVHALARTLRPDVFIERYYNFGGEGVRAARRLGVPVALEVNAPVIDYPRSPKRLIDRALLFEPMRRWRDAQCAAACLIVTPTATIVPEAVPKGRVLEIEWGADTRRFHPGAHGPLPFTKRDGDTLVVFAGAFRRWHGAIHVIDALRRLRARGRDDIGAVLIGDGPELEAVRRAAAGLDGVTFTGALGHDRMPACLAAADIGVAPFDVAAHAPLALEFYWSPLKIFEYMAAGLAIVAPDIPRLRRILTPGTDAVLYDAGNPDALAAALEALSGPAAAGRRVALGTAARERVVGEFSWDVHCRKLEQALRQCVS
jgi:glycosyltransferase involved in cell wall biosynthesis